MRNIEIFNKYNLRKGELTDVATKQAKIPNKILSIRKGGLTGTNDRNI